MLLQVQVPQREKKLIMSNFPQLTSSRRVRKKSSLKRFWMTVGLVTTFSLNFVLMFKFFPPIASIIPFKRLHHQSIQTCPDFGCPIYPAELTDYLHELLDEHFVKNKLSLTSSSFDFGSDHFALLTQTGKSHFVNQDRAVLISPFHTAVTSNTEPSFLIGVFDGHGREGHVVANHIAHDFPQRLANELNTLSHKSTVDDSSIIKALNKTVVEVDIYGPPNFMLGGSTATIAFRRGSKLYIANTGDSQTAVVALPEASTIHRPPTPEDAVIIYKTRQDKPDLPDEYARISALNGTIYIDPQSHDSRVIVRSNAAREDIMLAMSRSLGDWEWKPVGVIAEPIIDVIDLNQHPHAFLIAASDGVWGMRRDQFFAKQFSESFYAGNRHPLHQCWQVIHSITPKLQEGYRDDMTAVVMKL